MIYAIYCAIYCAICAICCVICAINHVIYVNHCLRLVAVSWEVRGEGDRAHAFWNAGLKA